MLLAPIGELVFSARKATKRLHITEGLALAGMWVLQDARQTDLPSRLPTCHSLSM